MFVLLNGKGSILLQILLSERRAQYYCKSGFSFPLTQPYVQLGFYLFMCVIALKLNSAIQCFFLKQIIYVHLL